MPARDRFSRLIRQGLDEEAHEAAELGDQGHEILLNASGRDVFLCLNEAREEVSASTMAFLIDGAIYSSFPELLADFNAYHMFHGGYRLAIEPDSQSVYVCVTRSLDGMEKTGLKLFLEDFLERCTSCTRWYADEGVSRFAAKVADLVEASLARDDGSWSENQSS